MWFGTAGGVSRYDGKTFVNFTLGDYAWLIYRDSDGVMWSATAGGLFRYDGIAWTLLDIRDGLPR